ncbi:MAG: hypothetical protein K8W52_22790 [Deltaproteobacteria bacterium]|nr:hypothetical protein [Deltaproteobacteria bacterium]
MIDEVAAEHGRAFRRCIDAEAAEIAQRARAAFVIGNPRVWWLALNGPWTRQSSVGVPIDAVLPSSCATAWFIVEDATPILPVYELSPSEVELIRCAGPALEFNYVEKQLRWMVSMSARPDSKTEVRSGWRLMSQ